MSSLPFFLTGMVRSGSARYGAAPVLTSSTVPTGRFLSITPSVKPRCHLSKSGLKKIPPRRHQVRLQSPALGPGPGKPTSSDNRSSGGNSSGTHRSPASAQIISSEQPESGDLSRLLAATEALTLAGTAQADRGGDTKVEVKLRAAGSRRMEGAGAARS